MAFIRLAMSFALPLSALGMVTYDVCCFYEGLWSLSMFVSGGLPYLGVLEVELIFIIIILITFAFANI